MGMKNLLGTLAMVLSLLFSCGERRNDAVLDSVNWSERRAVMGLSDTLVSGRTYLSVYSRIYSQTEHITHDLTATVSIRNTNLRDTVYLQSATYFDTDGALVRTYFEGLIFVAPMETLEIVIDEADQEGGTGGNFLFDWKKDAASNPPLFESVMISTSGQQGISFTTTGKQLTHYDR
jgi:hypothetical protein